MSRDEAAPPAPTSAGRRVLLLINRHAGRGGTDLERIGDVLTAGGLRVETHAFAKKHPIPDVIRERAGDADCVVIGGGDGTINTAIPALLDSGLPLGILPLGTANDLAHTLGIGDDPLAAARIIVAGRTRTLDLGEANGHLFLNVASIGLGAELADAVPTAMKRRWGTLAYAAAAFWRLARARRFSATLVHDGRTERIRTLHIAIGNGGRHGGGLIVSAAAEPDDGLLHLCSLEARRGWQLLPLLPALRRGDQGTRRDVRSFATTALDIRTRHPMPVNLDGAVATRTPVRLRLRRQVLRVYSPQ